MAVDVIVGWKAIAAALGRTPRSCRRYARRNRDPLPVYRMLGDLVISRTALEAWRERQAMSYQLTVFPPRALVNGRA